MKFGILQMLLLLVGAISFSSLAYWAHQKIQQRVWEKRWKQCLAQAKEIIAGVKAQYPGCEGVMAAISCSQLSTALARQTPVYDINFLKDFISDMTTAPFMGRHQTSTWEDGAESRVFDKVSVGQPNYTQQWNKRLGADCGMSFPTSTYVAYGTTRDQYFMENIKVYSQLFNLDQLRTIPNLPKQIAEIYRNFRKIPIGFTNDFIRTRMLSYNDTLYVCGFNSGVFLTIPLECGQEGQTPSAASNIDPQASNIYIANATNLPTSDLTWTYLNYYQQVLGLQGYDSESGLPSGMRSLVTHSRTYQRLVGLNPEIRSQVRLDSFKSASPLYMPGKGINAEPFGPFAPTFDEHQLRYMWTGSLDGSGNPTGSGNLQRVLPYVNVSASTGIKPTINSAWLNARYAITFIPHPKASMVFTPKPKKVHEMIPTINSAMWGAWEYINNAVLMYLQQDGTTCTINNELQWYFYWLCYLEMGFKYEQRPLVIPILHLIDGAGAASMVDTPICGSVPQYVVQNPSDNPPTCAPGSGGPGGA